MNKTVVVWMDVDNIERFDEGQLLDGFRSAHPQIKICYTARGGMEQGLINH